VRTISEWGGSPREAFIAILNNQAKSHTSEAGPVRTRGFVVLARNTDSLQAVQEWCAEQTWNECVAARYRIRSRPVFGTLFAALSDDVTELQQASAGSAAGEATSHGIITGRWPSVLNAPEGFFGWLADPQGALPIQNAYTLLRSLATGDVLRPGSRLVVLVEVEGDADPTEWVAATPLFGILPERIGLVLCGPPAGFALPDDDPHYLELDLDGVEATPGPDALVYKLRELASDRPQREDWLGFAPYATALAKLVRHPGTGPLTIAVHGPWGKGKSQFMGLVKQALVEPATVEGEQKEADVRVVEFNAWRYQDSTQIWAGLASEVTAVLEGALPTTRRLATPFAYAWRDHKFELVVELGLPIAVAGLVLVLSAIGIVHLTDWLQAQLSSDALATFLGGVVPAIGALLASVWIVASRAHRVLAPVSQRLLTYVRRPDYRAQMGYQHLVLRDLQFVERRLRGRRTEPRVVVLIDDLDRCPDDKIMEVLQAINLILGESSFYVVLGIDTAMIYRAIESHYGGDDRPLPPRFAETYLQKIVQLPFHLPETNPAERSGFVARLFSDAAREAIHASEESGESPELPVAPRSEEELEWNRGALLQPHVRMREQLVEDTATELRAYFDYQAYLADNPRELKRLVNVHRFVKIVLQQEGRPPSPELQRKLVKWLVFCARWPDLVDDVLAQARDYPTKRDCLTLAVAGIPGAQEFAALDGTGDLLTPFDLAPEGTLAKAASISHPIVWDTAVRTPAPA